MRDNTRTVIFAVALGLVCSIMLAGANLITAPYRAANKKAEELRNFLSALEVPVDEDASSKELLEIFEKNVRVREEGGLRLYEYVPGSMDSDSPVAVAVLFSGPGLWGPVKGVLALKPGLRVIRGIRFYEHEETPGLGGEISADWFVAQFVDKEVVSSSGEPGFRVVKPGEPVDINSVDGITGATMTSERVQDMLDALATKLGETRNNGK